MVEAAEAVRPGVGDRAAPLGAGEGPLAVRTAEIEGELAGERGGRAARDRAARARRAARATASEREADLAAAPRAER